jgi:competence protein ComFC
MITNPIKIDGIWDEGWSLDFHTTSSRRISEPIFIEVYNSDGQIDFVEADGPSTIETVRPPIAEALYQLKYNFDRSKVDVIAETTSLFLNNKKANWNLDYIIPIPPSDTAREFQPVFELAKSISSKCNLVCNQNILRKTKPTSQLKSIVDKQERRRILSGAFDCNENILIEKSILLFDDLYRSGETLNAAISILKQKGKCSKIYILTITKTRVKS